MVTYLVGTDGVSASQAISDYLRETEEVGEGDRVEAVYATSKDETVVEEALNVIDEQLGGVTNVRTKHIDYREEGPGGGPAETLIHEIKEVDADMLVVGLRRHSRTERIVFGSVSHTLIEKVTIPMLLVPLPEYQPAAE